MSVELYFLINLLADFSLLSAAARGFGCLRIRRVGPAAALSALFGTLAHGLPALSGPPLQLALLLALSALVTRRFFLPDVLGFALSLGVTVIVTGTCAAYCCHPGIVIAVVPGLCALSAGGCRRRLSTVRTEIVIMNRGRTAVLSACIDTGNHLTEPLSGQPVLIASSSLIDDILPASGFRQVAYGSVGGGGTLPCFRPERVYIDSPGRRRPAPDTWIAVYPARLPGDFQALAPAEYALH